MYFSLYKLVLLYAYSLHSSFSFFLKVNCYINPSDDEIYVSNIFGLQKSNFVAYYELYIDFSAHSN